MTEAASYIPPGLASITPYLLVSDASGAIDFYRDVVRPDEIMRHEETGTVVHARLSIGNSVLELGQHGTHTANDVVVLPWVGVHLYLQDVDAVLAKASAAGSRTLVPIMDQPYGDREVTIVDPFGVVWFLATHLHD